MEAGGRGVVAVSDRSSQLAESESKIRAAASEPALLQSIVGVGWRYLQDTCRHRPFATQNKSQTLTEHWQHFHGNCQSANNSVDADAAGVGATLRCYTRVSPRSKSN